MIEVNPRASRTVPFVSKAVGWSSQALPLAVWRERSCFRYGESRS